MPRAQPHLLVRLGLVNLDAGASLDFWGGMRAETPTNWSLTRAGAAALFIFGLAIGLLVGVCGRWLFVHLT